MPAAQEAYNAPISWFTAVTLPALVFAPSFRCVYLELEQAKQKRHCKRVRIRVKFPYKGEILIGSMPVAKEEIEC